MAHLGIPSTPGRILRPLWAVLLALAVTLLWTSSASAAVTQKQAAARAVDAFGSEDGSAAVIVFGLPKPVRTGTRITQAGTTKPSTGSTKGLPAKLRSAGVRTVRAPSVLRARARSYLFYEDRGPFQLYQHPGRVALVDVATGRVTLSRTITWPPLINGRLPAFLKSAGAYRSSKYQVFNRPWTVQGATQKPGANRNLFDQDPFGPGRPLPSMTNAQVIADRLAAERSCVLRVTDTLPAFWNAQQLDLTRSYVGTLFEALERANPGFIDDRYGARSGETLPKTVDRLVGAGCKDILLYIAGQGYSSAGEPVIHLGTSVRSGGLVAQQNISASQLSKLVSDRPGVTFKFKIDAPYSGAMIERLRDLPNVLLIETPSAAGDEAFAFIPQVANGNGQMVSSDSNPAGLLEFTNCELVGLKAFFDSSEEIDKATQGQSEGVSFLVEMLARAQELCNGQGGFADDLGAAPQLYAQKRASGNGTNRPPKAEKGDVTVAEDTPTNITLVASDPDGDPLTYTITKNPDHGTLSGSGPNVTYTPDANYVGPDDFSFKAEDNEGASNTAKVDITVSAVNDAAVVTNSAGNTAYTEGGAPVVVDGSLTVSDVDDTELTEATARIHADDFHPGDVLEFAFNPADPITGFYDTSTGTLTITPTSGSASVADMQAALRTVKYGSSHDNPKTPTRILYSANDGDGYGPAGTKNMAITNVNDAPSVDASDTALAYSENAGPVAVDPFLNVSDPDSDNLSGARVEISSNFNSGEDSLTFTDQNGITGTYDSGTGVLTLSGTASVTDYATALQSVAYVNSSDNPSTATRSVSFRVTDSGALNSNVDAREIDITPSNDAPVVTTTAGNTSYTEGGAAVAIDTGLTVSDVDDTSIESAEVRIATNFEAGDDLVFVDQLGISGTYDSGTGVLTLTGTASESDYQTALRDVRYRNTTDDNLSPTKTVQFKVNDGDADSAAAGKGLAITGVNDAPAVNTTAGSTSYTEGGAAATVDNGLTVSDPEDTNLEGGQVRISAGFESGDDLVFVNQNGISGSYNTGTGVLTLSGTATVANYQAALRSVQFQTTNDSPSGSRTIEFKVNDGDVDSNLATKNVTVTPSNDAPVVTTSAGDTAYTEGNSGTVIDGALTVSDADDTNIESAEVRISSGFESGDDLTFVNTANITGTYNTGTGVLTLTGTDTVANYQAALRSITFDNTTDDNLTSPKTISFEVNDGDADSNTATKNIVVTPVNDAPTLNTTGTALTYTEGSGPQDVDSGITVADPDSPSLAGATVQITSNFVQADDELSFTDQNGITGSYNDATGTLTLAGTSSVANYQTALRSVKYENVNPNPSGTRTVSFRVDDGAAVDNLSNVATRDINFAPVNNAPVVTTTAGATSYTEGDPATTVDGGLTVSDADDTNLESGQVRISTGFESGDDLVFVNQNGISGTYNTGTGVLTLTGTASVADYQTALRSIQYRHTGDNPTGGKTVEFEVNDGDADSNLATKTINITGVNDSAVLSTTATTLSYTEGDGAVDVDTNLTLDDPESHDITGATVQITSNFNSAEDDLVFVDQNGITGSYNDATGTLTLTGTASEADYQAALRSVEYQNTSNNPSTATRTVSFQTTGDTGSPSQGSNTATRDISVSGANDAPVVTTTGGSSAYTEGGAASTVDSGLTVSDAEDTNIEGGQVRISANFQSGDDLVFVNQNGISGTYNTGTGVLTLTGTASVADYQTALRSIQFQTTNDNPSASKTVEFKVNDGDADSNAATKNITVTAANDAPTLNTSGGSAAFVEDSSGPVAVDPNLTLTDPDSANMSGATVSITTGFNSAEDALAFTNQNGITGSYNSGTGVLTLSGSASVADYQTALRSVQYDNTDTVAPDTTTRTVSFQATDSSAAASNTATRNVTIASVNDAPVVTTSPGSKPYTEDDPATTIDGSLTVTDQDDTNLEGGQVRISSGFQSGDDLVFVNQNGISGTYNTGTGVLTLTGTASVADYQTALRSIQFQSTQQEPVTSKTVEFKVNDGDVDSNLATKEIAVTPTNDGPLVNATDATLSYTENDPATTVDPGLTIDDLENDNLSGGSASITANYQAGQDVLNWTDNNLADNITLDNVNSNQQTIVLTGIDNEANYQAALRAVTYQNGSEAPSTVNRTVTFSATDQPGLTGSDTRTISVTAVDDPPDAVNDSATVLEDAAATSIPVLTNDTDIDGGPKTIASATDPANGTVVLTGGSPGAHTGLTYQPDPNYCNDPPGTTPDTFQYTVNGGDTASVSMTVTCVNDAPVADDETFDGASSAVGNTTHIVNDPDDSAPTASDPTDTGAGPDRPHKAITGDILAGDTDVDGPGPMTVTPGTFATNDGGSVTIESDGDFTYEPAASTSCTDTSDFFDYTVEDSGSPEQTDTGRVTIAITDCVWYVNNHDAQGNSGTSAAPFDSTQQAETASGSGHHVYVYDGNNTTVGYTGLNMKQNQSLVGQAADLVVAGHTLQQEDNSKRPQLTDELEDVVALDDNNTVTGIEVDPAGAFSGIAGGSGDTGGGTIADVRIIDTGTAATNAGLELISTTGTFNVSDLTVDNTAPLTGQTGSSKGVELANAGTVAFNPTGTISITTTGGAGLDATSTNLGTSTFDTITTSDSSTGGVVLTNTTNPVGGSTTFGDLSLTTTSGSTAAFRVSSGGTISVPAAGTANVNATGGPAVDVTSTSGAQLNFDTVTSNNSASDGINLDGLGDGVFNASAGNIGGATGVSFDLNDGDGAISYPGNLNDGAGQAAEITGRDGGTVQLTGPVFDDNDARGGILVSGNSGGSTTFSNAQKQINTAGDNVAPANGGVVMNGSDGHTLILSGGGLDIDTTSGKGLEADGSGTIEVSGSGNTIDTTTGRALHISDTDIANNDVTFQRIASNGASNGIRLNNTGNANGRFVLQGNGGTCTSAGSCTGGAIQNSTTTGVVINNVPGGAEMMRLAVTDSSDHGIHATGVAGGILLDRSAVLSNGNATSDNGLEWSNVQGVTAIRASDIIGSGVSNDGGWNAKITNTTGTLHLTVNDTDFNLASTEDGLQVNHSVTATVRANITGNRFDDNKGDAFQVAGDGNPGPNSSGDYTFNSNTIDGKAGTSTDGGVVYSPDGSSRATFTGNTITNPSVSALILNPFGTSNTTTTDITANNNTLGNATAAASEDGDGIQLKSPTDGTAKVLITNNNIRNFGQVGMRMRASESTNGALTNLTATSNQISLPEAATWEAAIYLQAGSSSSDVINMCADIGGAGAAANTFTHAAHSPGTFADFTLDLRFANAILRLPGYTGTTLVDRQNYFLGRNSGFLDFTQDGLQNPQNTVPPGSPCQQPTAPTAPTAPPALAP